MEEKEEQVRSLSDQEQFRREKVQKIRDLGIDPFGHKFERTHLSSDIKKEFAGKTHEELEALAAPVTIAG
ncbi:MAG: lysine--tRNA ligase, partial [Bacilli bacterium]|nr:lysine--tRNA ligase [Bacilli bacterium]